jgi:integrase
MGMRRGEILALRRDDLNFSDRPVFKTVKVPLRISRFSANSPGLELRHVALDDFDAFEPDRAVGRAEVGAGGV